MSAVNSSGEAIRGFQIVTLTEKMTIKYLVESVTVWTLPRLLRKWKLDKAVELEAGAYGFLIKNKKLGIYRISIGDDIIFGSKFEGDLIATRMLSPYFECP